MRKLIYLLEYKDYTNYEDEYEDSDNFQTLKPKKRAKSHRIASFKKRSNQVEVDVPTDIFKTSEYTYEDLIKYYKSNNDSNNNWRIVWNHKDDHDLLDRIVNRTIYDVPYINELVIKIINYMERKWDYLESGDYIFTLLKSKFKVVLSLNMNKRRLFIGTILSDKMNSFTDITGEIILNESIQYKKINLDE